MLLQHSIIMGQKHNSYYWNVKVHLISIYVKGIVMFIMTPLAFSSFDRPTNTQCLNLLISALCVLAHGRAFNWGLEFWLGLF